MGKKVRNRAKRTKKCQEIIEIGLGLLPTNIGPGNQQEVRWPFKKTREGLGIEGGGGKLDIHAEETGREFHSRMT